VTVAALASLAGQGAVPATTVADAIHRYGIDPETPPPWTV
jgi:pyruvate dehydrogenase E1 component